MFTLQICLITLSEFCTITNILMQQIGSNWITTHIEEK